MAVKCKQYFDILFIYKKSKSAFEKYIITFKYICQQRIIGSISYLELIINGSNHIVVSDWSLCKGNPCVNMYKLPLLIEIINLIH